MGSFRFRKSIRLAPGLRINVNKKSMSLTAGRRGAHVTKSFGGRSSYSVRIPGTGLWYRGYSGRARKSADSGTNADPGTDERWADALKLATAPEGSKAAKQGQRQFWIGVSLRPNGSGIEESDTNVPIPGEPEQGLDGLSLYEAALALQKRLAH